MLIKLSSRRAASAIEYAVLIAILLGAFFIMKGYLIRGIAGRWKQTTDAFGQGRQFDPDVTKQCAHSQQTGDWYDAERYQACLDFVAVVHAHDNAFNRCIAKCPGGDCPGVSKNRCHECCDEFARNLVHTSCVGASLEAQCSELPSER